MLATLFLVQITVILAVPLNDTTTEVMYMFPESIPIFHVRNDRHTNEEVSRGRLNELGETMY